MTRMADVTALVLTPVNNGRWSFLRVTCVARNGARWEQPAVNTVAQARQRAAEWFPNATVTVDTA